MKRVILILSVALMTLTNVEATIFDLQSDFSMAANPNGVWSYNGGGSPLGYVPDWNGYGPSWTAGGADLAWTQAPTTTMNSTHNMVVGDVIAHSSDGNSTGGVIRPANVTWTAPADMLVDVEGGTWLAVDYGDRGTVWSIWLNDSLLSDGTITSFTSYNHDNLFDFNSGSGGSNVLSGIAINAGDVLKLQFDKTARWGAISTP